MKKLAQGLLCTILIATLIAGCASQGDKPRSGGVGEKGGPGEQITAEEIKRVDLYVTAMRSAFQEESGGNDFIAVKLETLEGLSDRAKQEVLNGLKDLSANVYPFEKVKEDRSRFEVDEQGRLSRAVNGALLSVRLQEFSGNHAIIEATSWFGNLGAVFPEYKATYKNGEWHLELTRIAVS